MQKIIKLLIKKMRNISIHRRLVLTFSITILIPTIIIASTNYYKYISHIKEMSMKNLESVTDISSKLFQDELNEYEKITLQINKNEELFEYLDIIKNGTSASSSLAISNILFDYAREFKYISNLQIVTEDRQFSQISHVGYKRGGYIKDLKSFNKQSKMSKVKKAKGYPIWFDTADETNIYFMQTNNSGSISDYLTLMRGMIDPVTKEQVATIVLNVDIRFIKGAINFKPFLSDGNIMFISEKGPLSSLNENIKAPKINDFPKLMSDIKEAKILNKNIVYEGNNIIFFNELPQTEYLIIQIIDRKELIKDALVVRNQNVIILIICIITAFIISYIVTRSISNPIDELALTMGEAKENQLPSMYQDSGSDEVTTLGLHYNEMLTEINNLINELYITEIKKNDAKLDALQMQINPHFIYNTLDFMRWEAMDFTQSENNLSKMISDFSKLLRLSTNKGQDLISIKQELDHIKAYLKVSNFRYEPPIVLTINENTREFTIPKLILQPIVENSIMHGFGGALNKKEIIINIEEKQRNIEISILDNGKGIDKSKVDKINKRLSTDDGYDEDASSIGLSNVNQRIKLYYGAEYGVHINQHKQGGTKVTINIPY